MQSDASDLAVPAIEAELGFFAPTEPGRAVYRPGTRLAQHKVGLRDARPLAATFDLDREGFRLAEDPSRVTDFASSDHLMDVYCPETQRIVARLTGASRTLAFDYTVRKNERQRAGGVQGPAQRVHSDFTEASGRDIATRLLEAARLPHSLLEQRFAIINVWRPIGNPVLEWPLGLCDARTVAAEDYILTDLVAAAGASESYSFRYNPAHRWFYFPNMKPSEIILLKVFDSANDGRARFVPHGSFVDPTSPKDAPPRHSIEVRVLALF